MSGFLRFGRNVLLIDLAMAAVALGLLIWQGWTSLEESTLVIFGGGAVLFALGVLPSLGPALDVTAPHSMASHALGYDPLRLSDKAVRDDPLFVRLTGVLLVAGFIPVLYAALVAWLFL